MRDRELLFERSTAWVEHRDESEYRRGMRRNRSSASGRWRARGGFVAALALLTSCAGADFKVRVSDARNKPVSGAVVRLLIGDGKDCGGHFFKDTTNAAGIVHVAAPACGEETLLVCQAGMHVYRRRLDTCDDFLLDVNLTPVPADSEPSDPCVRVADAFSRAYWKRDDDAVRSLFVSSSESIVTTAVEGAIPPWRIEWNAPAISDGVCTATATLTYEDCCEDPWSVLLLREGEAWRVAGFHQSCQ